MHYQSPSNQKETIVSASTQPALTDMRTATSTAIVDVLAGEKNVAVLDFPSHMNVGDSMIWAGERAYLTSLGVQVRYTCDIERFSASALRQVHPDGPILLHGGGNLGDIWPRFQEFRENVVREFPDRKIVQLPQTLYFSSSARAAEADRVFGLHPDFTVLLRDHNSMERARTLLPSVQTKFVRDMALGWTPDVSASDGSRGILILARRDTEAKRNIAGLSDELSSLGEVETADWGLSGVSFAKWKATRIPGSIARRFTGIQDSRFSGPILDKAYISMLNMNLQAGTGLFRDRSLIVTDRLHAHVLAALMNIPHVVFDNSYGKVKSIFEDYTGTFDAAYYASDETEAISIAKSVLTK